MYLQSLHSTFLIELMKKLLLLLLLLGTWGQLRAQQEPTFIVEGYVRDANTGEGLPGVNVMIKGTNTGTATDIAGWYRLRVPATTILVFAYVGMRTKEVKVVDGMLDKRIQYYQMSGLKLSQKFLPKPNPKKGVAILSDSTPSYRLKRQTDLFLPKDIRFKPFKNNPQRGQWIVDQFKLKNSNRANFNEDNWRFAWVNRSSLQVINRLPRLQNRYAQGRPINGVSQWQGAETSEIFSWGPAINTLSFDNSRPYSYDKNGQLITANTGQAAQAYDPLSFLRNGVSVHNQAMVTKKTGNYQRFYAYITDERSTDIVPNAYSRKNQVHASLIQYGKPQVFFTYTNQRQALPSIGANWQNILGNVFATPPTFDQANGLPRGAALNNTSTYTTANNLPRSPAPTLLDNPYGLAAQQPDYVQTSSWLAGLAFSHRLGQRKIYYQLGFNGANQTYETGVLPNTSAALTGRRIRRAAKNHHLSLEATPKINQLYLWEGSRLYVKLPQALHFYQQSINRTDAENFVGDQINDLSQAQQINTLQHKQSRWVYNAHPALDFYLFRNKVNLRLGNQFYVSSTLKSDQYQLFLPKASFILNLHRFFRTSHQLRMSGNYRQSMREIPLVNQQWGYNSTQTTLADYASYYPNQELLHNNQISPEQKTTWEAGIHWNFRNYMLIRAKIELNVDYTHETTQNLFAPIAVANDFAWANAGVLRNQVWQVGLKLSDYGYDSKWKSKLVWKSVRPVIRSLNNGEVALAGYQDAGRRLVAGQPYGVLYGSRYLRNANGQVVIDGQGYPVKDSTLGVLGNPNPAWVMQWSTDFNLGRFNIQWVLSYQHEGNRWNGTQAMLDYLGTSQQSADLRNTRAYVFAGVNQAGQTNQTAVDFANPANGLAGNRWVRYGAGGVAEDYIERASMWRLEQVKVSYDLGLFLGWNSTNAQISLFANNLLLFSPYSGLDPNSTLMNAAAGQGLDLFNAPGTTSFGVELRVVF